MSQPRRKPAVIGIDASRLAVGERTGTETYTAHIVRALATLDPPEQIRLYLNQQRPPPELVGNVQSVPMPFPRLWTHGRLSWEMLRRPPDVLFIPAHVVPLRHPPTVVTIHDLGYLHEPDTHPPGDRRYLDWSTRWSARAADRIIAVSETTKRDLIQCYGVPAERIRVIHHGVDTAFRPLPTVEVEDARRRLGLPPAFVLAVGTVHPRKNLGRLASAMRQVVANGLPHRLAIAGKRGWLAERVERDVAASGMSDRVDWLGYVPARDLPALYNAADAFCFPSLYEGFGLPALEAMACGVPTVLADRAALPEVAGGVALLADPTDVDALGAGLVRLLTDQALRQELTSAGRLHAASFTWVRAATATLEVLREVIDDRE